MADDMIQKNTTTMATTAAMTSAVSDLSSAAALGGTAAGASGGPDDPFAETKAELASRFELLPDDIKAVIMGDDYQKKLFDFAKTQKMTYEELGVLETETTMVLLGMTKPADYRDELQIELKKNDAEVDAIVTAINEMVFTPIRASLERLYAAKKDPADYIPESIATGIVEKAPEPVMPSYMPATPAPKPVSVTPLSVSASPSSVSVPAPSAFAPAAPSAPTFVSMNKPSSMAAPSTLTSLEKDVLGAAGVVINPAPAASPVMPASQIPDRANLLASIENPSRIAPASSFAFAPNLAADKLKAAGPLISATKTTDYSMPVKTAPSSDVPSATPAAAAPATPAKPYVDPYREPI